MKTYFDRSAEVILRQGHLIQRLNSKLNAYDRLVRNVSAAATDKDLSIQESFEKMVTLLAAFVCDGA